MSDQPTAPGSGLCEFRPDLRALGVEQWKLSTEFLPFHPQASHVSPGYRDGWNDCYRAALATRWPSGLIDRVRAAEKRMRDGNAPRSIPADPHSDVDLVLAEIRMAIEGTWPPFWITGVR